jgi:AcrR family transcriptional regulator
MGIGDREEQDVGRAERGEFVGDTRAALLDAALRTFERVGYEKATVASIRVLAGASNGSFFHFFSSKEMLAAALFLDALRSYHEAISASVTPEMGAAEGVASLVRAHLNWVMERRQLARFLFEQSRSEWLAQIRDEQRATNIAFGSAMNRWIEPRVRDGSLHKLPPPVLMSQIIGPAQMFCRAWLSGRESEAPDRHAKSLVACATRAVVRT